MRYLAPFHTTGKWLVLAAFVGIVAGLGAIAFDVVEQFIRHVALERVAGYAPPAAKGEHHLFEPVHADLSLWKLILVLAVGGFLSGLLVNGIAPEAEGHGRTSTDPIQVKKFMPGPFRSECDLAGPVRRESALWH